MIKERQIIAERISSIKLSPIRKVANLLEKASNKAEIISFGGGAPSLLPPKELIEIFIDEIKKNLNEIFRYCGSQGILPLRQKISEDLKKYANLDYDPENEIIITEGSTEGIFLTLASILEEGDEVILMNPTYLGYSEIISFFNSKEIRVSQNETEGYQPDIEELKEKITNKTKAIIINTPENPTGRIIDEKIAKEIVEIAKDKKIIIIVDEAYKHIIYEGKNTYIAKYGKENVVGVCSFSKEASLPGFRLGYVYADSSFILNLEKIKQFVTLCSNMPAQRLLIQYLTTELKDKYLNEVVIPTYKKRRDFMSKMIKEFLPESKFNIPKGAFYIFLNIKNYVNENFNDEYLVNEIFQKFNVVVIPGSYFGTKGKGFLRLTFVSEKEERIEEGIKRLHKYFSFSGKS